MLKRHHLADATNAELCRYHRAAEKEDKASDPRTAQGMKARDWLHAIEHEAEDRVREARAPLAAAVRAYKAIGGGPGKKYKPGPERTELLRVNKEIDKVETSLRDARAYNVENRGLRTRAAR